MQVCHCLHIRGRIALTTFADEWFVIAITDANFGRYNITAEQLKRAMTRHPKVKTALICIVEGSEATWYAFHEL